MKSMNMVEAFVTPKRMTTIHNIIYGYESYLL